MTIATSIAGRLFAWLRRETVWLHAVALLAFSYTLLLTAIVDSASHYVSLFLRLSALMAPGLLYAAFRDRLDGTPAWVRSLLWTFSFLLYPVLCFWWRASFVQFLFGGVVTRVSLGSQPDFAIYFIPMVTGVMLSIEGWIWLNQRQLGRWWPRWAGRWSPDTWLLSAGLLLAVVIGVLGGMGYAERHPEAGIATTILKTTVYGLQLSLMWLVFFGVYQWNRHWLIPRLYQPRGFLYYAAGVVATVLVGYPFAAFLWRNMSVVPELELEVFMPASNTFSGDGGGFAFLIMILSLPVIVSQQWQRQGERIEQLEQEKTRAELELLKQQLNPHFFFNTLNNLYAMSITTDRRTPEVIMQLSELMRYVIYRGAEDRVLLGEEIRYLEDYVSLQRIRLARDFTFDFSYAGADTNRLVPPLLFVNLVENAFKHGIEPAAGPGYLRMKLSLEEDQLLFSCQNSVEEASETEGGVGLENLRRRLQLRFPGRHELRIVPGPDSFLVELQINLA